MQQQQLYQLQLQQQVLRQQQTNTLLNLQRQQQMGLQTGLQIRQDALRLQQNNRFTSLQKQEEQNRSLLTVLNQQTSYATALQNPELRSNLQGALKKTTDLLENLRGQNHTQELLGLQSALVEQQASLRNALAVRAAE